MPDAAQNPDVVVVGGGMAGLAAALGLSRNGGRVTLLEQAPEFGEVGAGLQLAPNATRLLKEWGLLDEALERGFQPKHLVFRDAITGEELTRQELGDAYIERYGAPYLVIHRSDLHGILLRACERAGIDLRTGSHVASVETIDGGARVTLSSGEVIEPGAVIGADGLKSSLRAQVSDDEPVGSAYVAYRGTVDRAGSGHENLEDVVVFFGPDCHLVQYPLRGGALLNTVAVFKSKSFESGIEQSPGREELEEAYADCIPEVRSAIDNLWHGIRWPMYDRNPIPNWVNGRLLLIGDAAHPMLQYLAQGACQALEDAAVLEQASAGVFDGSGSWDDAFAQVQEVRTGRTARVQATARQWGESWHVDGIARTLRNLLFKSKRADDYGYTDWLWGKDAAATR
ncbi:FAD-dependent oxidoreductase [Diaminobutyricimonas sp. LJ205]|uniref:FAD-dependent oxidoreductase n=1 Tax=Diaminobutyricimonas sp. LJ205 TaxID=2683590 RepID=UPI0012F4D3BF|nr:FAD-dependent oxidoreductase [Diaminobutyricimonas sp. LJ205]